MDKPQIEFADFEKIDLRVGRIVDVQPFPRARNPSYKVTVDLGELGTRQSSAQIVHYVPEALIGRQVVCVYNFAPRNIAGFLSEVLILGARDAAGNVILLSPRSEVGLGQGIF
jgi:tRNA-binding protein